MPVVPRKVFVGGLAFDTTESTFRSYFEKFGKVLDAVVMRDPHTQRSRGFGFITFQDDSAVEECLSCSKHTLDGRQVETKRATPPEETPWKSNSGGIGGGAGGRKVQHHQNYRTSRGGGGGKKGNTNSRNNSRSSENRSRNENRNQQLHGSKAKSNQNSHDHNSNSKHSKHIHSRKNTNRNDSNTNQRAVPGNVIRPAWQSSSSTAASHLAKKPSNASQQSNGQGKDSEISEINTPGPSDGVVGDSSLSEHHQQINHSSSNVNLISSSSYADITLQNNLSSPALVPNSSHVSSSTESTGGVLPPEMMNIQQMQEHQQVLRDRISELQKQQQQMKNEQEDRKRRRELERQQQMRRRQQRQSHETFPNKDMGMPDDRWGKRQPLNEPDIQVDPERSAKPLTFAQILAGRKAQGGAEQPGGQEHVKARTNSGSGASSTPLTSSSGYGAWSTGAGDDSSRKRSGDDNTQSSNNYANSVSQGSSRHTRLSGTSPRYQRHRNDSGEGGGRRRASSVGSTSSTGSGASGPLSSSGGNAASRRGAAPVSCKIFVGGLHYDTDVSGLKRYFGQFGEIQSAEVLYNRDTGKSRGFGFVVFKRESSVNSVLEKRMHTIDDKSAEVKRATPKTDTHANQNTSSGSTISTNEDQQVKDKREGSGGDAWTDGSSRKRESNRKSQGREEVSEDQVRKVTQQKANFEQSDNKSNQASTSSPVLSALKNTSPNASSSRGEDTTSVNIDTREHVHNLLQPHGDNGNESGELFMNDNMNSLPINMNSINLNIGFDDMSAQLYGRTSTAFVSEPQRRKDSPFGMKMNRRSNEGEASTESVTEPPMQWQQQNPTFSTMPSMADNTQRFRTPGIGNTMNNSLKNMGTSGADSTTNYMTMPSMNQSQQTTQNNRSTLRPYIPQNTDGQQHGGYDMGADYPSPYQAQYHGGQAHNVQQQYTQPIQNFSEHAQISRNMNQNLAFGFNPSSSSAGNGNVMNAIGANFSGGMNFNMNTKHIDTMNQQRGNSMKSNPGMDVSNTAINHHSDNFVTSYELGSNVSNIGKQIDNSSSLNLGPGTLGSLQNHLPVQHAGNSNTFSHHNKGNHFRQAAFQHGQHFQGHNEISTMMNTHVSRREDDGGFPKYFNGQHESHGQSHDKYIRSNQSANGTLSTEKNLFENTSLKISSALPPGLQNCK
eukprot:g276.t1